MPEGTGRLYRLTGFDVVHVGADDGHLRCFRMMESGQDVRNQGAETAPDIEQPIDIIGHVGDDDDEVFEQCLLDTLEIPVGQLFSRLLVLCWLVPFDLCFHEYSLNLLRSSKLDTPMS